MKILNSDQNSISKKSDHKNSIRQSQDSQNLSPPQIQTQIEISQSENKEQKKSLYTWKEIIPKAIILIILAFIIIYILINNQIILDLLETFIPWDNLLLGILIYWLIYTVAGICMVPNTIFGLCAGYVFYTVLNENLPLTLLIASILTLIGSSMGATSAFLAGRYALTTLVKKIALKFKKFQAIQKALKNKGFKFVLLCRLTPITPNPTFSYLCGGTDLKFKDYFYGCIGLYPGLFLLTYFGTTIKQLKKILDGDILDGDATFIFLIISGVFGVTVAIIIGVLAKREISRILKEEEELEKELKEKEKQQEKHPVDIDNKGQQIQNQEKLQQKYLFEEKQIKAKARVQKEQD